jgi:hypothetical protein
VADERDVPGAGTIVFGAKCTAERGTDPQHIEEPPGNTGRGELFGLAAAGEVEGLFRECRDGSERSALRLHIPEARVRERLAIA